MCIKDGVRTRSIRSPGKTKPATEVVAETGTVTARIPGPSAAARKARAPRLTSAARVSRWPGGGGLGGSGAVKLPRGVGGGVVSAGAGEVHGEPDGATVGLWCDAAQGWDAGGGEWVRGLGMGAVWGVYCAEVWGRGGGGGGGWRDVAGGVLVDGIVVGRGAGGAAAARDGIAGEP